jgi:adenylate kinase
MSINFFNMVNIIILGSAGVGKGTNAKLLVEHYKIPTISSGEIFRQNIEQKTELGLKAKEYMNQGILVPDEITKQIIVERLSKNDCKTGFILDGFPRNLDQAKWLDTVTKIDAVVNFTASEKIILERLSGRYTCSKCGKAYNINTIAKPKKQGICDDCGAKLEQRDDDQLSAIKQRLKVYRESVSQVIDYYNKKNIISDIDSSYPYEQVKDKIVAPAIKAIDKLIV